jgi:hypothetical protein
LRVRGMPSMEPGEVVVSSIIAIATDYADTDHYINRIQQLATMAKPAATYCGGGCALSAFTCAFWERVCPTSTRFVSDR